MEEIKIYHSPWRMLLLGLGSMAFVAMGVFMLQHPDNSFHVIVAWASILFFGPCGIYTLYAMLKERLTNRPYLTITDKSIILQGTKQIAINFADVQSFQVVKMGSQKFVAIHYKPDVEQQKMDDASTIARSIRSMNRRMVNAQENISTVGTGMKAEELCDLLSERLGKK